MMRRPMGLVAFFDGRGPICTIGTMALRCAGGVRAAAATCANCAQTTRRAHDHAVGHAAVADERYCLDMVRRHDHTGHLAALLLPDEPTRMRARAVRAFNVEVALIREAAREPATRAMRYQFWLDAVDTAFEGAPARHPVALCLADAVREHPMSPRLFKEIVRARSQDASRGHASPFATLDELEDYADSTVTAVFLLLLEAAGARSETADRAACHVGRAVAIAGLLRAAPFLLTGGEVRFPRALVEQYVPDASVLRSGASSPELEELAFALGSVANSHLENARRINGMPTQAKLQFLPAVACQRFLDDLLKANFNLYAPALQQTDGLLPLRLLWHKIRGKF